MNLFSKLWYFLINNLDRILVGLLVFLVIISIGVMGFDCVKNCVSGLVGLTAKNKILTFLGIGMGGILFILQVLASHRRAKAMEDAANEQANSAKAQARATEEQARANENTEQGLRQERLKNAIEHLGDEKNSVRLGGAYELFHLAEDTEELRQTVLDILCVHIRQTTGEKEYQEKHESKPSEEVQSLLTLLFVQEHKVFRGLHINLQGSWLNGADLRKARLEKAILTEGHLQGATLAEAQLQEANLVQAGLQGTDLHEAQLQKADLSKARLQGAILQGAKLQCAQLIESYLQEAILDSAYLQGTDLRKAHLQKANFHSAHLQGAVLDRAYLQRTELINAYLQGAVLDRAYLREAVLFDAHLQGAVLCGAQLQEANLAGAHLQGVTSRGRPSISMPFENRIRNQIGKETDLSGAVFVGGLSRDDMDSLREEWRLEPHIGKPASHELPEDSGAIIGTYTKEEAEEWIAEHEKAISEVPKDDS